LHAEFGAAGNDGRTRMLLQKRERRVERMRSRENVGERFEMQRRCGRFEKTAADVGFGIKLRERRARILIDGEGGVENGDVSGAAAEIARESRLSFGDARRFRLWGLGGGAESGSSGEGHDEAWRAKAALRAMAVDHGLLNRVKFGSGLFRRQAFNGDDVSAVDLVKKLNARIDGEITQSAFEGFADEDGARPAIAFGADDFRAGEFAMLAEIIGERGESGGASNFDASSIEIEKDMIAHAGGPSRLFRRGEGQRS